LSDGLARQTPKSSTTALARRRSASGSTVTTTATKASCSGADRSVV
jgi:hypothetical protein